MKKVFWLVMLALLLIGLAWLGSLQRPIGRKSELVELQIDVLGSSETEMYNASGVSLEGLLALRHNASFAGRLKCLDGVCDSGKYWWRVYINQAPSMMGVRDQIINPGDSIRLEFS